MWQFQMRQVMWIFFSRAPIHPWIVQDESSDSPCTICPRPHHPTSSDDINSRSCGQRHRRVAASQTGLPAAPSKSPPQFPTDCQEGPGNLIGGEVPCQTPLESLLGH